MQDRLRSKCTDERRARTGDSGTDIDASDGFVRPGSHHQQQCSSAKSITRILQRITRLAVGRELAFAQTNSTVEVSLKRAELYLFTGP
jgi:hypothetical protein